MTLVDHTTRAIPVQKVDSQKESLWEQLEGSMSFDEEIEEIGAHKPLDLCLDVDGIHIWESLGLKLC
jgi:hypothetical protein